MPRSTLLTQAACTVDRKTRQSAQSQQHFLHGEGPSQPGRTVQFTAPCTLCLQLLSHAVPRARPLPLLHFRAALNHRVNCGLSSPPVTSQLFSINPPAMCSVTTKDPLRTVEAQTVSCWGLGRHPQHSAWSPQGPGPRRPLGTRSHAGQKTRKQWLRFLPSVAAPGWCRNPGRAPWHAGQRPAPVSSPHRDGGGGGAKATGAHIHLPLMASDVLIAKMTLILVSRWT